MAIEFDPKISRTVSDTHSVKRATLKEGTAEKLSYTDADGKSFNLTINRDTKVDYALYDRQSVLKKGSSGQKGAEETGSVVDSVPLDDPSLLKAVKEFRAQLIKQLVAASRFGTDGGPLKGADGQILSEGFEVLKIDETITIDMDNIDTEYWSVENTAARLVDFAKSLYAGGDRSAHVEKMIAGIEQGYGEAKEAFGGTLPDISAQTVDLAIKTLKDWAAGAQTPVSPEAVA